MFLSLLFFIVPKILARPIREEERKNYIQIGKKEIKLFLFTDDMRLYIRKSYGIPTQNNY